VTVGEMRGSAHRRVLFSIRRWARADAGAVRTTEAREGWPPGHFYSPVVSAHDIERHRERVYATVADRDLPGLALDLEAQLETFARIAAAAAGHPWSERPQPRLRYGFDNPNFGPGESLLLWGMFCDLAPRRVIEIGAGWSTRAILDIRDRVLDGNLDVTAIEPYASEVIPDLMSDPAVQVIEVAAQETGLERFLALEAGDVLFVDSSHVVKFGSDVQFILNDVLPRLAPGVRVHFHDVMYPFEYPLEWVRQGRNWNEAYALRAFLTFNSAYTIDVFAAYVWAVAPDRGASLLPRAASSPGSSLWLRRL
jgi:Methyltransferase domain